MPFAAAPLRVRTIIVIDNATAFRNEFDAVLQSLYFGSAGVGPLPRQAIRAMGQTADRLRGRPVQDAWDEDRAGHARRLAARLIGAVPENIVLTSSTSEGLNLLAAGLPWRAGDNIVTSDLEYPANIVPWLYQAEHHTLEVRIVPSVDGAAPPSSLRHAIDRHTRVLAVSHVEFGTGFRHHLPELADAVHDVGGLLCVDAIQSVGVLPIDVEAMGIDLLATGGYKWLCGPLGTGFAYVHPDLAPALRPPSIAFASLDEEASAAMSRFIIGGEPCVYQPPPLPAGWRRFERSGGASPVLLAGFNASMQLLLEFGVDRIAARIAELTAYALEQCSALGIRVVTPIDPERRAGILTLGVAADVRDLEARQELEQALVRARIVAFARAGGLRLAIHAFNTVEEIDRVLSFAVSLLPK